MRWRDHPALAIYPVVWTVGLVQPSEGVVIEAAGGLAIEQTDQQNRPFVPIRFHIDGFEASQWSLFNQHLVARAGQVGVAGSRLVAVIAAHQLIDQLVADGGPLTAEMDDPADAAGRFQGDRCHLFQIDEDKQIVGEHGFPYRNSLAPAQLLDLHHGVIGFDTLGIEVGAGAGLFFWLAVGQIPFFHVLSMFVLPCSPI